MRGDTNVSKLDMKREIALLATEYIFEQNMGYKEAVKKAAEKLDYKKYLKERAIVMRLDELYQMQKKLDHYILLNNTSCNTSNELLTDTLLALQVEVSELANATRCFKHWSKKGPESKERLLDEYADVLHFFLSVGLQLGFSPDEVVQAYIKKNKENYRRQVEGY